jgi:hypothetical protein
VNALLIGNGKRRWTREPLGLGAFAFAVDATGVRGVAIRGALGLLYGPDELFLPGHAMSPSILHELP